MYEKLCILLAFVMLTTVLKLETSAMSTETNNTNATTANVKQQECNLEKSSKLEMDLLDKMNRKLKNMTYEWKDTEHKYYFTVCSSAPNSKDQSAGFVQINMQNNNTFVLGRLNDVDVEGFDNFIRLTYNNGDNYARACGGNNRSAVIYIVCDPTKTTDEFSMVEENNERDKQSGCAYIFKLKTSKTCDEAPAPNGSTTIPTTTTSTSASSQFSSTSSSLSSTTTALNKLSKKIGVIPIIFIILSCLIASYFIIGVFYLRFVKRARGWQQVPNHTVWQAMGNRIGDCCANTCHLGNRTTQVHSYENINDRISDDENLLN